MSTRNFPRLLLAIASGAAVALCAPAVEAQEPSATIPAPNTFPAAASSQSGAVALSFGVPDVLKLSRAHVSDDTIVAFIGNSGRTYNLTASEVVYLHEQGVSERVITTMLNQRRNVEEAPAPQAPAAPSVPTQSSATYAQTAPASTPSSSVYVFPSSSAGYSSYNYYPTYGYYPYYSYPYYSGYSYWPSISLAFGYGNYYGSGYYGGYHGNYWNGWHGGGNSHWGGGWHGGGSGSGGWHGGGGGWQGGGGSHGGGGMGGGFHGGGGMSGGGHR
jgi:hypothetical protein